MNNKLFVGGIPYATTEDELRSAFEAVGEVTSVRIITDKMTGRSRGFAFVEMASEELAQKAIEQLDNTQFGGRTILVSIAKPREERA